MKKNKSITAALLALVLSGSLSVAHAVGVIYTEGFSTNSTVMATNPAAPTATSTDYAVLSTKDASNSAIGSTLDLTMGGTSSGLAEMQAIFANSPVTLNEGETLRFQLTFEGTYLMDGGDSYGSPGSQFISFGLYDSGGSNPVPGGALATGLLGLKEAGDYGSGYAAGWKGYVGRIGNLSQNNSAIVTRDPQTDTWNESQDALFDEGITGGYDTPRATILANGQAINLDDGVYTMVLDITKTISGMQIDQYLYAGAGASGAVLYNASASDVFRYDTFDALAFGYRGRANLSNAVIHLDVSALEVGIVDTQTPSVSGLGDQSVIASQSITLQPVIFGAEPLSIQWSSNSVAIAGETNKTLQLNNIQLAQDGTVYSVLVSNALGSASASMTLTVTPPPPSTGLYNIQLNYGDGSAAYMGAAQIGSTNDLWNNPAWDGVGTLSTNLFSEYIIDSGGANAYGVIATLTPTYNDGLDWNSGGTFNHYSSRNDGSANPAFMEKVVKVDSVNPLTLALSNLPTNTTCTVYLYGSGNKNESGYTGSLAPANTNGGIASATIMYDTNSVNAATGRDVTLATSQGLSWEVLSGSTDASGNLTITLSPPGIGNAANQIFTGAVQVKVDLPVTAPTVDPVLQSIAVSGGTVTLSWTAEDLGTYSILRKTNLLDATWSTVVSNLPSGNLTTNVPVSGADAEFYQIKGE